MAVAAVALATLTACPSDPNNTGPTSVTERTTLRHQPGGVGPEKIRIRICVSGASICETYRPDSVKNCQVGDPWPGCKED
jgi:hypothetical protein